MKKKCDFFSIEIQLEVIAQDTTTMKPTTTPVQPSRKIPVQQYRPKAQDFLTNIDTVPIQALSFRKSEPPICTKMRSYLDSQIKQVYETILSDVKRITTALSASRSSDIDAATTAAKNAIQRMYGELADISNSSLTYINGNCSFLNTTGMLNNTLQGLEDWRQSQLQNAVKLAGIPESYEAQMQGNYAKIEKIIGTNF